MVTGIHDLGTVSQKDGIRIARQGRESARWRGKEMGQPGPDRDRRHGQQWGETGTLRQGGGMGPENERRQRPRERETQSGTETEGKI